MIPIFREREFLSAQSVLNASIDALAQLIHLIAGVVEVILARYRVTIPGKEVGNRVAHGAVTAMSSMQGACWICTDVLNVNGLTAAHARASDGITECVEVCKHGVIDGIGKRNVDKPRTSNLHPSHEVRGRKCGNDCLGKCTWLLTEPLCEDHGNVGRQMAMTILAWDTKLNRTGMIYAKRC